MDHASEIWLLVCSKLAINEKNDDEVVICWHKVILNFFDVVVFLLSSLVIDPSFMSISSLLLELWSFFYKEFGQKSRNRNTPVWVLFNIWRLGGVKDVKFSMNVSIEKLLNAEKITGLHFYRFWVIKGGF